MKTKHLSKISKPTKSATQASTVSNSKSWSRKNMITTIKNSQRSWSVKKVLIVRIISWTNRRTYPSTKLKTIRLRLFEIKIKKVGFNKDKKMKITLIFYWVGWQQLLLSSFLKGFTLDGSEIVKWQSGEMERKRKDQLQPRHIYQMLRLNSIVSMITEVKSEKR